MINEKKPKPDKKISLHPIEFEETLKRLTGNRTPTHREIRKEDTDKAASRK